MTLAFVRRAAFGLAIALVATSGLAANVLSVKEKVELPEKLTVWLLPVFSGS